ncbi:hypothetical protein [Limnoglobus roseus]|nr:hypothetical protein [Limnoglobus roseus]
MAPSTPTSTSCGTPTHLTMLGRNGVDLRTAQELAGHSMPLLTARYYHCRLYDLAGAVEKLPNLLPETDSPGNAAEHSLRMTGTDGVTGAMPGAVTGGAERHVIAPNCTFGIVDGTSEDLRERLEMKGAGASQHRPASNCTELPGKDSNPVPQTLQMKATYVNRPFRVVQNPVQSM